MSIQTKSSFYSVFQRMSVNHGAVLYKSHFYGKPHTHKKKTHIYKSLSTQNVHTKKNSPVVILQLLTDLLFGKN